MPFMALCTRVFVSILMLAATHLSGASAQPAGDDIVITKKDGKFSGHITAKTFDTYPGIVSDIELRFVWSGIFDQPTEYYQFIWNKSDSVQYAGKLFGRESLSKYPDLQSRFDDLRPSKIELSMNIFFGSHVRALNDYSGQSKVDDRCLHGYEDQYGCGLAFSKTITETPHLMVAAPGKVGDNITPTSPVDNWVGFFETNQLSGDPQAINRKLHDMMRRADTIRVRNLRLVSYSVPTTMVSAIIEEFYKREAEEAEKKLVKEATTYKEDEKSLIDKLSNFFSDDEDESDDFWGGEDDSTGKDSDEDDFWSGEDTEVEQKNEKTDVFWRNSQSDQAVKNSLKKAERNRKLIRTDEIQDCGTLAVYSFDEGYVDANGNWLTPPSKKIRAHFKGWWRGMSSNDERNILEYKYGIGWNQPRAKREFKERCTRQAEAEKRRMGASNAK